ncbi:GNAT family N-acetyltransferase [Microbacterium hominis]|uniref:GNAT family N-acetyltransferase n=2 Tax=Microbacterium hominis TaxID=162426 RepID=A0A7D4QLZ3_9MICO|nr:GNAT family N-acetyltransferase [Microbacterium hominis]
MPGLRDTTAPGAVVLETDRLLLRRWIIGDAALQRRLWEERDPRAPAHRRLSPDGHPTVAEFEDRIRTAERRPGMGLLVAVRRDDGAAIGYCGLIANPDGPDDEPEIAYELLRAAWGRGYATEAAHAVVAWASASGHRRLWATVRDWNTASRRVVAKLGFVETDRVEPDAVHGDSLFHRLDLPGGR